MTLLLIPTLWILGLALVVGLCTAARRGDRQQLETRPEPGEQFARHAHARQRGREQAGQFAPAGRAAA
jgi:hypothetical protein